MKTSKPLRVGVMIRPYELLHKTYAVVTLYAPFRLDDPKHLLTDMEMWLSVKDCLGEGGILDEGLAKVSAEVLVGGRCHPPRPPQAVSYVRVALEDGNGTPRFDKRIAVFGDRVWQRGDPSPPEPFTEMPITWSRAFGGDGEPRNPEGKGKAKLEGGVHPLPNLEDPSALVTEPSDAPRARTFLPWNPAWPQRIDKHGKNYGDKWLAERFPGPADDVDPTFYHLADDDQRVEGYLQGGERFVIENMNPAHPRIEGHLPSLVGRAFIARRPADVKRPRRGRVRPEPLEAIRTRIDTVWFFPDAMMGVLVFRGTAPALDDDLADIEQLMVALEDPSEPKPMSHYEEALAGRLSEEDGAIRGLDDGDLLPSSELGFHVSFPSFELEAPLKAAGFTKDNQLRKAAVERERARQAVLDAGQDPADYGLDTPTVEEPALPALSDPKALAAFARKSLDDAEAMRERAERERVVNEASARETAREAGLDFDAMMEGARREVGPPKVWVRASIESTRGELIEKEERGLGIPELRAFVDDEKTIQKLEGLERELIDTFRLFAHLDDPGRPPTEEVRRERRAVFERARASGASLANVDLSGADLSGQDLSGMDLSGAFLEAADLRGARLVKAKLDRAVFARANLAEAVLDDASLVDAILGASNLLGTSLERVDATRCIFDRAEMTETRLRGARLDSASFVESRCAGVVLEGITGANIFFLKLSFEGVSFRGAKLTKCLFFECNLDGACFDDAFVPYLALTTVSGKNLSARGANLEHSFVGHGSNFDGANFDRARLVRATLRTTSLVGASFIEATLTSADLSECDATRASFDRASAKNALFLRTDFTAARLVEANLTEALLSKANLAECDLTRCNLFRSEMSRVHVSGGTKIDHALLDFARVVPKEEVPS